MDEARRWWRRCRRRSMQWWLLGILGSYDPLADQFPIRERVETFNSFTQGTDARGERHFAAFEHESQKML